MAILENGKNSKRNLGVLVLAWAILALGAGGTCLAQTVDNAGSGLAASIEGTWIFTIDRVTQGITFTGLQSFTAGGVTVATGTIDRTPPPPISPLYGSWKHSTDHNYVASLCFFAFDPAGNAVAMIKNQLKLQLVDNNNLTGTGEALVCDTSGENCVAVNMPITITGKRLVPGE
jgi:hypothetical protein